MLVALVVSTQAHAMPWTLVHADAPVVVIHDDQRYTAGVGQRLAINDMIAVASHGGAQLQDDETGNRIALGPDTHALLMRDDRIALLDGWVKATNDCTGATHCVAPEIETARLRVSLATSATVVVAAAPSGYGTDDAVFIESGAANVLALGEGGRRSAPIKVEGPRFAARSTAATIDVTRAHADPAFVDAMPISFRDALPRLVSPTQAHPVAAGDVHPVDYNDVSNWLISRLAARRDAATRFTDRFNARLADASFRRDVQAHLRDLPEWRVLIYPPPRVAVRPPAAVALTQASRAVFFAPLYSVPSRRP